MRPSPRAVALIVGVVVVLLSPLAWLAGRKVYARFEERLSPSSDSSSPASPVTTILPALERSNQWLAGGGVAFDSLAAHPTVVLLWSDTRPGCLRVLPRVQAWHDAYARYGLRVIGVHEPEFAFAADSEIVAADVHRLRLTFPIALDPSLELASAFGVAKGLPRLVLFDAKGQAREEAGEADVAELERAIRRELRALNPNVPFPADPEPAGAVAASDAATQATVYLGTSRAASGPLATATPGREQLFSPLFRSQIEGEPYTPYPVGLWKASSEGVTAGRGGAETFVALRYDAGTLGAVLSPPERSSAHVWILRDEHWLTPEQLGADARLDGRGASYVEVSEPRLYDLCRASTGDHVVKLSPEVPGVTVHAITFEPVGELPRP